MYRFENNKRGVVLIILTFVIMVGLSGVLAAYSSMAANEIRSSRLGLRNIQAFYIAEAGRAKARWALTAGGQTVPWSESHTELGNGTFSASATNDGSVITITSAGYIPNYANPIAKRQVAEKDISFGVELTNLSLESAISASSEKLPQNPATNAKDGDSGSEWKAGSKDDAWLKLDYGSSTTVDRAIYTGNNINSVTIEYSNNGVDYNPVTNAVESPAGTINFDSVSARYLRLNMDVDSKSTAGVYEFESYNSAEDVSATLGKGKFSTSW